MRDLLAIIISLVIVGAAACGYFIGVTVQEQLDRNACSRVEMTPSGKEQAHD